MLSEYGCREVVLIQPEKQSKKKTDRRDANSSARSSGSTGIGFWTASGCRAYVASSIYPSEDAEDRQLTEIRKRMGQLRTRTINQVKHLLRKHNLEQECPTKGLDT